MAILVKKPDVVVPAPTNPNLQTQPIKTMVVDSQLTPLKSLITHVEGSKWVVEYFNQYITADDETASFEETREGAYQQYLRIRDYELRVTAPLQATQDSQTGEWQVTGAATVYVGMIPNVGNMFVADVGDGRAGMFTVTRVERKSILSDATYAIEYEYKDYAEADYLQLIEKTVKHTVFVRDFVEIGKVPLLIDSEYSAYQSIQYWLTELPRYYYYTFYNAEFATFLVPDQLYSTYDPFLMEFVRRIVPVMQFPEYERMNVLNCDTGESRQIQTLFNAILNKEARVLQVATLKSELLACRSLRIDPRYSSIRYSGIAYVNYPKSSRQQLGTPAGFLMGVSKPREFNLPIELDAIITQNELGIGLMEDSGRQIPVIKPVTVDDYYVFSESFYQKDNSTQSMLEIMVQQYLDGTVVDIQKLIQITAAANYWGLVEQFYYIPILQVLLSNAIKDIN